MADLDELRMRVEAAYYGLRYDRMTTLEVLDELYAVIAASEPRPPTGASAVERANSDPSRRERIATAALQGLIASDDGPNQPWSSTPEDTAKCAIGIADALAAALDATEPPQPPPARDPDMLGSAGIYQTTDPSYSGELTAGGSTGDGERACVDEASDAQHAPKRPTPAVATEADRIGGATAAPEPPAAPVACPDCRKAQQADAERQANLRLRADLVEAVRELRSELETHREALDVTSKNLADARAELEQLQDDIEQELGWPDVTSEDRRDYSRAISDAKLRITVAEEQQEQLRAELEQAQRVHEAERRQLLKELAEANRLAEERLRLAACLQADLEAEQSGRLEIRRKHGAGDEETMGGFIERLATERDAARAALARLRAKVGPVVEWWRAYTPALVDMRHIVPVFARRLDVLKAGWED